MNIEIGLVIQNSRHACTRLGGLVLSVMMGGNQYDMRILNGTFSEERAKEEKCKRKGYKGTFPPPMLWISLSPFRVWFSVDALCLHHQRLTDARKVNVLGWLMSKYKITLISFFSFEINVPLIGILEMDYGLSIFNRFFFSILTN